MLSATKTYKGAFLINKARLTRLVEGIRENFSEAEMLSALEYRIHLSDGEIINLSETDDVLGLDNSLRKRIKRMVITETCGKIKTVDDTSPENKSDEKSPKCSSKCCFCEVDFDGGVKPTEIISTVKSNDNKSGYLLLSFLEEQIDRTIQRGIVYRIIKSSPTTEIVVMIAFFVFYLIMISYVLFFYSLTEKQTLQDKMWLTEKDVTELQKMLDEPSFADNPQMLISNVYKRQIRNLSSPHKIQPSKERKLGRLYDWRIFFIVLPVVVILGALIYLFTTCYPLAVFLWGDYEEEYTKIEGRRKTIWIAVVVSLIISILAGLFIFSLTVIAQPPSLSG